LFLNKLESTFGQGEMKQDADCLVGEERGEWKWEVRSSTLQGCWQFAKHGQVIDMSTAARKEKKYHKIGKSSKEVSQICGNAYGKLFCK